MPKHLTKAQTRKRLREAQHKLYKVILNGDMHLSAADVKSCYDMTKACARIGAKLR